MDLLQQLSTLDLQLNDLQNQRTALLAQLETHVSEHGEAKGYGYSATFKPGRAVTDHEAAAKDAGVSDELIAQHSTTKTTVKWAVVTKKAGIDTAAYTTRGEPKFAVEVIKESAHQSSKTKPPAS